MLNVGESVSIAFVLTTEGASHTDLAGEQRFDGRVGADLLGVIPCTHNGESRRKPKLNVS